MRSIVFASLFLLACGPTASTSTPQTSSPPGPTQASCDTFEPPANACLRALEIVSRCCWDRYGLSRSYDGLGQVAVCERARASGRDPQRACESFVALFEETNTPGECRFDEALATSGDVLGIAGCCCHYGRTCRAINGRPVCVSE